MSNIKALLLTDVVDSTKLALELGEAAIAALWAEHDRVARDLLPVHSGREIDKTDGMLLLFDHASDAIGYALAYQAAMATLQPPVRARVGLHVGPVALRENSIADVARGAKPLEVDGVAKATAARVMSVALGGQILVTAIALQVHGPDAALSVRSHGHWRLRGIDEPLELFEVGTGDTSFMPPSDTEKAYRVVPQGALWVPVREIRHSLPAERDAFVGRDASLSELARQLRSGTHLLSVTGPGGTGKTRLVTRFGWAWLGEFPGGIWFCDLSAARSAEGVVVAVAQGLGLPLVGGDPVHQIGQAIAARSHCLVILDNFEQVSRHAAETLGRWLDCAPEARFVDTTREVLGLAGERVLALNALPPEDAVRLFRERASAAVADFSPGPEDERAILPLVNLLEGLPLAIELAAARVRAMSPRMLLQRMGDRFKLLAAPGRRQDRQATLRATLDWSWDLLEPALRAGLAQLSVFEGGFTLESAEAVIDASACLDAPWTVDLVASLVDKSLVRRRGDDRFDLLVSVQMYAAEQLQVEGRFGGSGPSAQLGAQRRHMAWFAAFGPLRAGMGRCLELDNLVAACRRAVAIGETEWAAGALEGAWGMLGRSGPYALGVALGEAVCAMPGLTGGAAASALGLLSRGHANSRRLDLAMPLHDQAVAHAQAAGDQRQLARLSVLKADLLLRQGRRDEAQVQSERAIALARAAGELRVECRCLMLLAVIETWVGRFDKAEPFFVQALALADLPACQGMRGGILHSYSPLLSQLGRPDEALACLEQALTIANQADDRLGQCDALGSLGWVYFLRGQHEESLATSLSAMTVTRELGSAQKLATSQCNVAIARAALGQFALARQDFEAAIAVAREIGDKNYEGQYLAYFAPLLARLGQHDEAARCLERGESLLQETADPMALGVLQCCRAATQYHAGDSQGWAASLAAADAIARELGAAPSSDLGVGLAHARALGAA